MADRVRGNTFRWKFSDGPMKNRAFEHTFERGGAVKFRSLDGDDEGKMTKEKKYEAARVNSDVDAVSYLGSSGYTLTVVLNYKIKKLVAFASNEKELMLQHGTFEVVKGSTRRRSGRRGSNP